MIITYKNGKEYALDYDEGAHSYKVDGVKVPSVTKIVDGCFPKNLTDWALSVGKEEYDKTIEEALQIGNDTHAWIEEYIKADDDLVEILNIKPAPNRSVEAFLEWYAWSHAEFIESEQKIYCDKYKYAGTVDAVAKINGRVCVIDFKTSKKIYKPYHLQVSAYAQAIRRMNSMREWPLGIILRLDKETGQYQQKVFETKDHFQIFLKCIEIKNWSSIRITDASEKIDSNYTEIK